MSQASVQVAAGSNQAVYTVTQSAVVTAPTVLTITAAAGGVTKTARLTINPTGAGLRRQALRPVTGLG